MQLKVDDPELANVPIVINSKECPVMLVANVLNYIEVASEAQPKQRSRAQLNEHMMPANLKSAKHMTPAKFPAMTTV